MRILLSILFIGFFLFTNGQPKISDKNVFEFRGVWVATVENIDWPSKRGLSIVYLFDSISFLIY